jgi:hypothetical protein
MTIELFFVWGVILFFILYVSRDVIIYLIKHQNKNSIDDIIDELEFRIHRHELSVENGDEEAKEKISILKSELKKARSIKKTLSIWK